MQTAVAVQTADATAPAPIGKSKKPLRVTGRLKAALDLMAWDGLTDNEAAVSVGMNVLSIRLALNKPHVRAYYRAQLDVLRQRESGRNIHALLEVRDQKSNQMARVQAVKALEQISDEPQQASQRASSPGFVVIVAGASVMGDQRAIEAKPLIQHASVQIEAAALPKQGNADD